jgi:hypothetical protein
MNPALSTLRSIGILAATVFLLLNAAAWARTVKDAAKSIPAVIEKADSLRRGPIRYREAEPIILLVEREHTVTRAVVPKGHRELPSWATGPGALGVIFLLAVILGVIRVRRKWNSRVVLEGNFQTPAPKKERRRRGIRRSKSFEIDKIRQEESVASYERAMDMKNQREIHAREIEKLLKKMQER